ncbi:MAG: 50S ribosomal protein L17 [Defluviitaleaceae bacterium]|nr:50S ribosomal protein L17 [Defluviitaleaceae bacterium]
MANYRKLGWKSDVRRANMRALVTHLLYHGKITTTVHRAKEIRGMTEKLITLAVKEKDNYTEVTKEVKVVARDSEGKRLKQQVDGKSLDVFNTETRTIRKDNPSRLNARRKMLSVLYPVTEVPEDGRRKKALSEKIDMPRKLFEDIAPKYENRNGGYTRITRIGPRKGDGAEMAVIELV